MQLKAVWTKPRRCANTFRTRSGGTGSVAAAVRFQVGAGFVPACTGAAGAAVVRRPLNIDPLEHEPVFEREPGIYLAFAFRADDQ